MSKKLLTILIVGYILLMGLILFINPSFGAPQVFISTPATTTPLRNFSFTVGTTTPQNQYGSTTLAVYGSSTIQTWLNTLHALEVFNAASTSVFRIDTVNSRASTSNLILSNLGNSATNCLQINNQGVITVTGASCASGGATSTEPLMASWFVATSTAATSSLQDLLFVDGQGTTLSLTNFNATNATNTSLRTDRIGINSIDYANGQRLTVDSGSFNIYALGIVRGWQFINQDLTSVLGVGNSGNVGNVILSLRGVSGQTGDLIRVNSSAVTTGDILTLNSLGKLGIGTTTPNWNAQIASTTPFLVLSDTLGGLNAKHWFISSQNGNLYVGTSSDVYATTTYLTILNGGLTGIGTTSPTRLLTAAGTLQVTGNITAGTGWGTIISNVGTGVAFDTVDGNSTNDYRIGGVSILSTDNANNLRLDPRSGGQNLLFNTVRAGNVAIGTTTPNWPLQVSGAKPSFVLSDTGIGTGVNGRHWFLQSNNAALNIGTTTNNFTATSTYLTINNGGGLQGSIGIGTTTPGTLFSIAGNGTALKSILLSGANFIYASSSTSTIASAVNSWTIATTSAVGNPPIISADGSNGRVGINTATPIRTLTVDNVSNPKIGLYTAQTERVVLGADTSSNFTIDTAGSERARIDSSGRLGIGTTNPQTALDVVGTTTVSLGIRVGDGTVGDPGIGFTGDTDTGLFEIAASNMAIGVDALQFVRFNNAAQDIIVFNENSGDIDVRMESNNQANMFFLDGGNDFIGIATSAPWRTFSVNGSVALAGITAGSAGDDDVCMTPSNNELTDANGAACLVSSIRFKENIMPQSSVLSLINKFNAVTFTFKPELDHSLVKGKLRHGLIAEEVEKIAPELVSYEDDGVTPRSLRWEEITTLLLKGEQELIKKVEEQDNEIKELKKEIKYLKSHEVF